MKVAILINKLSENPLPDELDVLEQVEIIEKCLTELGHNHQRVFMTMNLEEAENNIKEISPDFVFNLFEGIKGKTDMLYVAAGLLQNLRIPYSGNTVNSIFITADKALTKKILRLSGLPTAKWFSADEIHLLETGKKYILKPLNEDASLGITDKSVFEAPNMQVIDDYKKIFGNNFFAEEFLEGREFNISVMGTPEGPVMLTPAEMLYNNYPEDKPKIMNYSAKWDEGSFEYENTWRTFDFTEKDSELLKKIEKIAISCWNVMNLRGYARVDMRLDKDENPYILEINANPCLAPNSGFFAAATKTGHSFSEAVQNIINDSL